MIYARNNHNSMGKVGLSMEEGQLVQPIDLDPATESGTLQNHARNQRLKGDSALLHLGCIMVGCCASHRGAIEVVESILR
ncbi:hypothetical protein I3760_06G074000 [Carya illinoinensis]|nr:hypothetical protein I3760_06G074000 [Carya illinoinensis]